MHPAPPVSYFPVTGFLAKAIVCMVDTHFLFDLYINSWADVNEHLHVTEKEIKG